MGSSSSESCLIPEVFRGLRVLLVDEDTSSLMYIASMLEDQLYKVKTIELASVALSMIQEEDQFDLVIADTNMKEMDIFTFLNCILLKRDMPIIFMSLDENMYMARKALIEGACFFLDKPVHRKDLINVWQHVYRKQVSEKMANLKADNEKPEKDSCGSKIVKVDSLCRIASRNDLYICKEQMINVDKGKQGQSNRIQGIQTMENDYCGGKIEAMGCLYIKGKQGLSSRKRAYNDYDDRRSEERSDLGGSNSKGLKSIDDGSERRDTDNESTEKRSRMKWTPALHLKFMEAISALGNKKAHPKAVLRMMNDPNLTVRHVASRLQKYRDRVKQINWAADLPVVPPIMTRTAYNFYGASGYYARLLDRHNSMMPAQGLQIPSLEIGASPTKFTPPISLTSPGLSLGSSVMNEGELHGLNRLSPVGPCPNANQRDEQLLGFDGSFQNFNYGSPEQSYYPYQSLEVLPDVHQQLDPFEELNAPYNWQDPSQVPTALPDQLTLETSFLQGQTCSSSFPNSNNFLTDFQATPGSSGHQEEESSTSFSELVKLLEGDKELEEYLHGQPKEGEGDIDRFFEWLGTPPDSDNDFPE